MTVPARHIRCIKASQGLASQDDVFQDFIDGMTDMDIAIGIRRAVVQDKFRPALHFFAQFLITLLLIPAFQPFRLAFGQIASHGKRRIQ